ncbi:hypothetical protein N473_18525 [Pseudoalteromonas luteoviolacea CPMOR-1]|uniref:Uncharacterized protein n=1 Tax=Pseudoalteromonas luteoviolacea CPMOR-1 TaxID=1365248 RepID=A0A162BII5_9GAMM|nr:hypothetical protein [Pseudoalteromonas luteoviolacea]KZN62626.1 hypothetical protein N473_18525 [Pseudoalteromonas luteoviolacea CPMOR-1]
MKTVLIHKLAELLLASFQQHDRVSISINTYPRNHMIDVVTYDHTVNKGKPDANVIDMSTVSLNSPDAEKQLNKLIAYANSHHSTTAAQ